MIQAGRGREGLLGRAILFFCIKLLLQGFMKKITIWRNSEYHLSCFRNRNPTRNRNHFFHQDYENQNSI
jgi:hypothetical protein